MLSIKFYYNQKQKFYVIQLMIKFKDMCLIIYKGNNSSTNQSCIIETYEIKECNNVWFRLMEINLLKHIIDVNTNLSCHMFYRNLCQWQVLDQRSTCPNSQDLQLLTWTAPTVLLILHCINIQQIVVLTRK